MNKEANLAKHLIKLDYLHNYLKKSNIQSELIESSKSKEYSSVRCLIGKDNNDKEMHAEFIFLLTPDDFLFDIELLQMISVLNIEVQEKYINNLSEIIQQVNPLTLLGNFYIEQNNKIIFRYTYITPISELIDTKTFNKTFNLFKDTIAIFQNILYKVALGELNIKAAMIEIEKMST